MPLIDLSEALRVEPSSYYLFKSNLQQVVKANFEVHEQWSVAADGTRRSDAEKNRIIAQVQDRFCNGTSIPGSYISSAISKSLTDKRNHQRTRIQQYLATPKMRMETAEEIQRVGCPTTGNIDQGCWHSMIVEELQMRAWTNARRLKSEVKALQAQETAEPEMLSIAIGKKAMCDRVIAKLGKPPKKLRLGAKRAMKRGNAPTHRLGQGGTRKLQAEFVSVLLSVLLLLNPCL